MTEIEYDETFDMRLEKEHQQTLERMRQIIDFTNEINPTLKKSE